MRATLLIPPQSHARPVGMLPSLIRSTNRLAVPGYEKEKEDIEDYGYAE
jgi:hypothetical protein